MAPPTNGANRAPESQKTNTQLVEDLRSAPGVDELKLKNRVAIAIHEDANDGDPKQGASLDPGKDDWEVHGGRLGRDHTLEDVPNHYLRDRLMTFTNEREIAAYSNVIRKDEARLADGYQTGDDSEWQERCARHEEQKKSLQKMDSIAKIAKETFYVRGMGDAVQFEEQNAILAHIDPDIDMTPHPSGQRNYDDHPPIRHSVFHFGPRDEPQDPTAAERKALRAPFTNINYDCDQVRALVKRFIARSVGRMWTLDHFRQVCELEWPQLIGFLEKSGPQAGAESPAYGMCWEFIRRRQALGLSPFFDQKKADRIFPYRKVKLPAKKCGRPKQPKQPTPQQLEKKREAEELRKKRRPTDAELRERRRAEAESKQQDQQQQEEHEQKEQQKKQQQKQQKKREPDVERPTRASKRIKAQKAGG
ncbi:hypothetical protein PG988_004520 [Apiospora saccharicola]